MLGLLAINRGAGSRGVGLKSSCPIKQMPFARAPTANIDMADQEKGQHYEASDGDHIAVPVKNGPFAREKQIQVEHQDSIDPEKIKGAIPIIPAIVWGKDEESDKCGRLSGEPGADVRVPRQRMHSVPFAIPPGLPVAWTSLTLPSKFVLFLY